MREEEEKNLLKLQLLVSKVVFYTKIGTLSNIIAHKKRASWFVANLHYLKSSKPNLTHNYVHAGTVLSSEPHFQPTNLQLLPREKNTHIVSSKDKYII